MNLLLLWSKRPYHKKFRCKTLNVVCSQLYDDTIVGWWSMFRTAYDTFMHFIFPLTPVTLATKCKLQHEIFRKLRGLHWWLWYKIVIPQFVCMVDNPLAKACGLSPRTPAHYCVSRNLIAVHLHWVGAYRTNALYSGHIFVRLNDLEDVFTWIMLCFYCLDLNHLVRVFCLFMFS